MHWWISGGEAAAPNVLVERLVMRAGELQQPRTPREIYGTPANAFAGAEAHIA